MNLTALAQMTYPGRFIIVARRKHSSVIIYGLTGRSPSSQARKLVEKKNDTGNTTSVSIEVTNQKVLEQGNPALLVYDAMLFSHFRAFVSNGAQTRHILEYEMMADELRRTMAGELISEAMHSGTSGVPDVTRYEPDEPNWTPRISGIVDRPSRMAALHIVRRGRSGNPMRSTFELELDCGEGTLISTYSGEDTNPLPSFRGCPLSVEIDPEVDADYILDRVWNSLRFDYRIAVAMATIPDGGRLEPEVIIRNRHA